MEFGDRGRVIRPILVTSGAFYNTLDNLSMYPNDTPPWDDMVLGPIPSITTKTASAKIHTLVDGRLSGYTITDGGSGYSNVLFVGASGRPGQNIKFLLTQDIR